MDMLPLFPGLAGDSTSPASGFDEFSTAVIESWDLAEEPEFESMFVEPLRCAVTYAQAGEEKGYSPDSLRALPDEEREAAELEILVATIRKLLTDDLRQAILAGLDKLRSRFKRAGKRREAARAAALQSFLGQDATNEMWAMIGLVQAIFYRSAMAGFDMADASLGLVDARETGEGLGVVTQRLAQSDLGKKAEALLRKVPGLGSYFSGQADKIWDEGLDALIEGNLYLGLFSEDELLAGAEALQALFASAPSPKGAPTKPRVRKPKKKEIQAMMSNLDRFLTELLTPERFRKLQATLVSILKGRAYEEKSLPFLLMLSQYLAEEDAVENEKPFLVRAYLGEVRAWMEKATATGAPSEGSDPVSE